MVHHNLDRRMGNRPPNSPVPVEFIGNSDPKRQGSEGSKRSTRRLAGAGAGDMLERMWSGRAWRLSFGAMVE